MKQVELNIEWSELPVEFDFQINNEDFSRISMSQIVRRTCSY